MQEVEIVNNDGLEVVCPPKKKYRTIISTTPITIIARSGKKSSDVIFSQQRNDTSAAELPATADFIKKMTEKVNKAVENKTQSPEGESNLLVHASFDD